MFRRVLAVESLAFVHRILDDLRPLIIPVITLVEERHLFPLERRCGRRRAVPGDPKVVQSITRMRFFLRLDRRFSSNAREFVQSTQGDDVTTTDLKGRRSTMRRRSEGDGDLSELDVVVDEKIERRLNTR